MWCSAPILNSYNSHFQEKCVKGVVRNSCCCWRCVVWGALGCDTLFLEKPVLQQSIREQTPTKAPNTPQTTRTPQSRRSRGRLSFFLYLSICSTPHKPNYSITLLHSNTAKQLHHDSHNFHCHNNNPHSSVWWH